MNERIPSADAGTEALRQMIAEVGSPDAIFDQAETNTVEAKRFAREKGKSLTYVRGGLLALMATTMTACNTAPKAEGPAGSPESRLTWQEVGDFFNDWTEDTREYRARHPSRETRETYRSRTKVTVTPGRGDDSIKIRQHESGRKTEIRRDGTHPDNH